MLGRGLNWCIECVSRLQILDRKQALAGAARRSARIRQNSSSEQLGNKGIWLHSEVASIDNLQEESTKMQGSRHQTVIKIFDD